MSIIRNKELYIINVNYISTKKRKKIHVTKKQTK